MIRVRVSETEWIVLDLTPSLPGENGEVYDIPRNLYERYEKLTDDLRKCMGEIDDYLSERGWILDKK